VPHLPQPCNRLQPTETFFDALPFPLADLVSRMPRGARINSAARYSGDSLVKLVCRNDPSITVCTISDWLLPFHSLARSKKTQSVNDVERHAKTTDKLMHAAESGNECKPPRVGSRVVGPNPKTENNRRNYRVAGYTVLSQLGRNRLRGTQG
jgi:hypothetical protein